MKQSKSIWSKVELFLPANFPVLDILKKCRTTKQIGLNLTETYSGAMLLIRQLASVCSDEEKTNAPFNQLEQLIYLNSFKIPNKFFG